MAFRLHTTRVPEPLAARVPRLAAAYSFGFLVKKLVNLGILLVFTFFSFYPPPPASAHHTERRGKRIGATYLDTATALSAGLAFHARLGRRRVARRAVGFIGNGVRRGERDRGLRLEVLLQRRETAGTTPAQQGFPLRCTGQDVLKARYEALEHVEREVPAHKLTRDPHPRLLRHLALARTGVTLQRTLIRTKHRLVEPALQDLGNEARKAGKRPGGGEGGGFGAEEGENARGRGTVDCCVVVGGGVGWVDG